MRIIRAVIVPVVLALAAALGISACAVSGPSFRCRITPHNVNWQAYVTVYGPTPSTGVGNVNVAYYNATGREIGSDFEASLNGLNFAVVPAGERESFDIGANSMFGPDLSSVPASCSVTGWT